MDQSSVLVACLGVAVTAAFTTKCFSPPTKLVKIENLDYDLKDDEEDDEDDEEDEEEDEEDNEDEEDEDLVKNDDVYDDLPALESGEITDDEMAPLIPVHSDTPALEECEYVSKDEFDSGSKAILAKIDEYHDAMAKALDDKYNDVLSKTIDDKIDHLRKELNSSVELDIMESSIQLEEKIMKNIKEWFIPLHAKKELDKSSYQGWKGEAERDSVTLQVAVKNTTYTTYEENDAWVDVTNNSEDSVKYRDSLLGLNDNASWSYSMNTTKTNASLTKRYVTLGWNHSVGISVVINNMPIAPKIDDNGIKTQAMELLKQLSSSIVWKRVLIPTQTNNA